MYVPSLDIYGKGNGVLQRMLSSVRKEKIKKTLLEKKEVSVSELAETFSVSDETIRRDLRVLEEEGFARRSHGGATLSNRVKSTVDNSALAGLFVESKRIIAAQCERFIRDGDCIFLDGSTTASAICERIQQKEITVLTNSLRAINMLNKSKTIKLICVGGNFLSSRQSFVGPCANDTLSRYYVDTAFISCRSLSMENGITDSDDDSARLKQLITRHANRVVLIADHTKFGKTSFTRACDFCDIHDIVTDRPLTEDWLSFALSRGLAVWDTRSGEDESETRS